MKPLDLAIVLADEIVSMTKGMGTIDTWDVLTYVVDGLSAEYEDGPYSNEELGNAAHTAVANLKL